MQLRPRYTPQPNENPWHTLIGCAFSHNCSGAQSLKTYICRGGGKNLTCRDPVIVWKPWATWVGVDFKELLTQVKCGRNPSPLRSFIFCPEDLKALPWTGEVLLPLVFIEASIIRWLIDFTLPPHAYTPPHTHTQLAVSKGTFESFLETRPCALQVAVKQKPFYHFCF